MNKFLTLILIACITACSHPLDIVGEGDIQSASGNRTCLLEDFQAQLDNCSKNYAITAYQETYYAVPRSGWEFDHWENYCLDATDNSCGFDFPVRAVRAFWGRTVPPLRAVFTRDDAIPVASIITVDGREWVQPAIFSGVSWNTVNAACPDGICSGTLNGYDVAGWAWASVEEMNALFNFYIGAIALEGGPAFFYDWDSDWRPAFFADGWTLNYIDGSDHFVIGHTSTSLDDTLAYRADFGYAYADIARTDVMLDKKNGDVDAGAWLYRIQEISDRILVSGRVWAQPDLFRGVSWNQIQAQCPDGICATGAVLNGFYLEGWKLASVDEVNELFNHYVGEGAMGPGPDSVNAPYYSSWGTLIFDDGFRPTLGQHAIEGLTLDTVMGVEDSVHVGVLEDGQTAGYNDNARTYGYHGKEDAYGFTGAWFYRPLQASDDSITIGNREWAQPDMFTNLSWYDVAEACPSGECAGTLNGIDVTGWTWASVNDVVDLFNTYGVTPALVGPGDYVSQSFTPWAALIFSAGFRPTYAGGSETGHVRDVGGWTSSSDDNESEYTAYYANIRFQPEEEPGGGAGDFAGTRLVEPWLQSPESGVWLYRNAQ